MSPALNVRRAQSRDVAAIVAMLADDHLGAGREDTATPLNPAYTAAFEAIDADANQFLAVVEEAGAVIGTLHLTFLPGLSRKGAWRGQIEAVRIAGGRRGDGLGGRMIEWAIEECRRRGCVLVQLTTDRSRKDAHRFYERLGFEQTHLGYKLTV
ncbi:GNAT family N-acetyltransferase [Mangrovibrevibacter kandeliae]|uniref:GNAT family N-acetyltransferase n=1 Tax=Mangrovibrevibacter kandeliae TaxID=2968473 RepID=UPI0021174F63|nr:GNAT family N-acetyltransferase [Aurantimonas sp. CSK15Z-1]MCQ8781814.1 GNAT family N-acetyltransferase [Aurantimonas sp. CSK15Z-1]